LEVFSWRLQIPAKVTRSRLHPPSSRFRILHPVVRFTCLIHSTGEIFVANLPHLAIADTRQRRLALYTKRVDPGTP
jgi:hypothetical protein